MLILQDIPLQMNGSDCGVFATHFADFASRRADILFNQVRIEIRIEFFK